MRMIIKQALCLTAVSTTLVCANAVTLIPEPDWVFEDDFEGERNSQFWSGEGVYVNYGVQDPNNPDNRVMEMRYVPNSEGAGDSWSEYDFRLGVDAVQLEMSFRIFTPSDYSHIEHNHKLFYLWSGQYGTANANISIASEAWGQSSVGGAVPSLYIGVDGSNFGHAMNSNSLPALKDGEGRWSTIHVFLELAEGEGDYGRVEVYKDGHLLTSTGSPSLIKPYTDAPDASQLIKYSSRGNYIDQGTLLGWANGAEDGGFQVETKFLIDDFKIKANVTHRDTINMYAPSQNLLNPFTVISD